MANRMPHQWLALAGQGEGAGPATADDGLCCIASSWEQPPGPGGVAACLELNLDRMPPARGGACPGARGPCGDLRAQPSQSVRGLRQPGPILPASGWVWASCFCGRGEFIGYWRLRDWLRLLSFEVVLAWLPPAGLNNERPGHWSF